MFFSGIFIFNSLTIYTNIRNIATNADWGGNAKRVIIISDVKLKGKSTITNIIIIQFVLGIGVARGEGRRLGA